MKVETFEEQVEVHPEACEEANRLIAELGLKGQSKTATEAERVPYRQWSEREQKVYSILCPTRESVEQYEAASIPLRALQVLAHAKSLGIFEGFEVWHALSPAVKDPILVGFKPTEKWNYAKRYILARWGAELDEFAAMERQAARLWKGQLLESVQKMRGKVEALSVRLASNADEIGLLDVAAPAMFAAGLLD